MSRPAGASAWEGCAGGADLSLAQSISPGSVSGQVRYQLTAVNLGPCPVDDLKLVDTLAAGQTLSAASRTDGWRLVGSSPGTVALFRDRRLGAGRVTSATIEAGPANGGTNAASISGDIKDPDPADNVSFGALLGPAGGAVATSPPGQTPGQGQTTQLAVPPGAIGAGGYAGVVIGQGSHSAPCPPGVPNCFGGVVVVSHLTTPGQPLRLTFNYDVATPNLPPFANLTMYHEPDGASAFVQLARCGAGGDEDGDGDDDDSPAVPAVGCIQGTAVKHGTPTSANPTGEYFQIVVLTPATSRWEG